MKEKQKILSLVPINVERLNKIGNNDVSFTNAMLEKFTLLASECSNDLWQALNKADWLKLKYICHKNIPSYSLLELNELVVLLKSIEKGVEQEKEGVRASVELMFRKNNEVVKAINEYLTLRTNVKDPHPY